MRNASNSHYYRSALLAAAMVSTVQAADSVSNSFTGFSGDTSQAGTQAALAGAGFEVDSIATDPAVVMDSGGAHFGSNALGDIGRNYIRTLQSDYATVNFTAEITFSTTSNDQAAFIGFGAGGVALFGTPDWSTLTSSASFWPETSNQKFVSFKTANDVNEFSDTAVPGLGLGTHRFRMTFDLPSKTVVGAIDLNYAGGAFVADVTSSALNLTGNFAADGWPTEPSRIFFGGDDGIIFQDLAITVDASIPEMPAPVGVIGLGIAAFILRRHARKA